jgi:SPP1 gp7 family putative phage head morphogenesis protein
VKRRVPKPAEPKTLPAIRPNAGTEAKYRKALNDLIDEMANSVRYWIGASYKANEPVIAQDETPAAALQKEMRRLRRQWQKKFNARSSSLAEYFATSAEKRTALQLQNALRDTGMTVKFTMTPAMRDVMKASINEQVSLIKSIPSQYFTQIEGAVMRSVSAGRDLGSLAKELQEQHGVTRRRAATISRDQNNKATAQMTRVRRLEIGITEAIWLHSGGGKHPRPKHLAFSGKRYNIKDGAPIGDKGQNVHPGEEINCRCVSKAVIPGLVT